MTDRRFKVLVVDDEPANLSTFSRALRRELAVTTAGSGTAALELIRTGQFDFVLTDYAMPDMDGLVLLQQVMALAPSLRRVVVTGHEHHPDILRAESSRLAELVVAKPWNKLDLLAQLEDLASKAR